ncbi:radical SAM protein [Synechocystis sp. LEGE 06083]|uniref:radical SAM protein n=1 Tax=Synechocystis sp. LEGE 06083 TaxID=915336 RepID=UPI001881CD67|nr:radical SAM protein [Synechocystis sp. LEGE 06083]MBE9195718.1 radical SAM protein [Synechocystis sp. LEGE 06083]
MNVIFPTVYGPVVSWRYGRSLGIDPIGAISTCSFNCVYCQLGEIEHLSGDRQIFVDTADILVELDKFAPWQVDVVTLSGSGEPTLAKNLGEILQGIKTLTGRPTLVLTNATLLNDAQVREELSLADKVSVKLDGLWPTQLQKINRPIADVSLEGILAGIEAFQKQFTGELSVQTMVLQPWDQAAEHRYLELLSVIKPREVQLNTPTRPKPLQRELEGRGNHTGNPYGDRPVTQIKCVDGQTLQNLAQKISGATGIPVRCAPLKVF